VPDFTVDHQLINLFQIEVLNGRNFSKDLKSDSASFIINEKLAGIMGMEPAECIGKKFRFHDVWGSVIGVVKDFNFKPLQYSIDPLVLRLGNQINYFVVKTSPGQNIQTINSLKEMYSEFDPGQPMTYGFVDQELDKLYQGEEQMGRIFNLFGVLAIFISCLGLYGLAAFVAEQHTKELGIRKVLGANIWSLANLLSIGFIKLVILATVIALPIAWYFMNEWLQSFAYHVEISWWGMVGASLLTLFITLLTVSYQIIKATSVNPVESLRAE
jgi:ABC-type antimicrobial peptide transport system permease subunit